MNERLRELAKQASIMVDTTFGQTTMPEYKAQFDLNKFAELIVEECGEIAYKAYWDNPETVRGIHIKEKIKQHFGVEE